MYSKPQTRSPGRRRAGFTLIELLMVISIIALLLALIVPSIQGVIVSTRDRAAAADITGLENAVADFNAKYGVHPPSRITLYEQASGWTPQSKALIRRIFGREFNFNIDRDIDGDGNMTDVIDLTGDECLVFFLGGLPRGGGDLTPIGFSKSKTNPFSRGGSNRVMFFSEWSADRLQDRDSDGIASYFDKLNLPAEGGSPLLYFSKMVDGNYHLSDCPSSLSGGLYTQAGSSNFWKDFQIISPGRDHAYGTGGAWSEQDSSALGSADQDNITNFSGGALQR